VTERVGAVVPARPTRALFALALCALLPAARPASAQAAGVAAADSATFARVRLLASDGDAPRARLIVDSALSAAPQGSPAYAEALYWRATLAVGVGAAEMDYRRLAVEHGTSPRAADALVRLAELEVVRGRPAEARHYLARLLAEHRDADAQARAHYWRARIELEAGDARLACDALDDAHAAAPVDGAVARQVAALRPLVPRCTPRPAPPAAVAEPAARLPYTVQLAAYDRRDEAEAFARRLQGLGVEARVSGSARPFRVRMGRYATRAAATAALRELRQRRLDGFVADAEPVGDQPS
jgi:septal ring-binding cell division protein DamX